MKNIVSILYMKKIKIGGKLTCKRKSIDNDCIEFSCVDYEKQIYNSKPHIICPKWSEYYDETAKSKYWYNKETEEATWINPIDKYNQNADFKFNTNTDSPTSSGGKSIKSRKLLFLSKNKKRVRNKKKKTIKKKRD